MIERYLGPTDLPSLISVYVDLDLMEKYVNIAFHVI
jgi:hypothetical protein